MTAPRPDADWEEMRDAGYTDARPPLFPLRPPELREEHVATIYQRQGKLVLMRRKP
jgi:hypothetical protein